MVLFVHPVFRAYVANTFEFRFLGSIEQAEGSARSDDSCDKVTGGTANISGSTVTANQSNGINIRGGQGSVIGNTLTNNGGFGLSFANVVCSGILPNLESIDMNGNPGEEKYEQLLRHHEKLRR